MNYNKSSTKRRMNHVDSKGAKIKNKIVLTILKTIMVLVIVIAVVGVGAGFGVAKGIIDSAPDISKIDVVPTGFSTTVLSSDGEEIAKLVGSGANREYVTLDKVPLHMQQAFVAIEDERFYEHNGIDLQSIARAGVATVSNLLTGKGGLQGGSTITQQLIKNNVLVDWTGETTIIEKLQRKIQEQYLALKLEEQVQDKDWILENYLNTINLGSNTLGVQAASNKYFGKEVSELTLSESAVIAGITQNPYGYDPIRFPEENAKRRTRVLDAMLRLEYITQTQYDIAMADNVYDRIASYNTNTITSYNSYFVDALIEDVLNDLIKIGYSETEAYKLIYQGGLTIKSTQDMDMQAICDEEANNEKNYPTKAQYSFHLSFSVKKADGTTKNYSHQTMLSYYKQKTGNDNFSINYATEEACYEAIAQYQQEVLEEGDTLVDGSESIYITLQPQIALTIIDQETGEVKALTGGRGDKVGNRTWNRATDTTRQPGSTFKIIGCYAPALDAGGKTLASIQDDAAFSAGRKSYRNADGKYHGFTTLREAIKGSYNITTVKTLQDIGVGLGYEYALKFGFTTLTEGDQSLSLALGGLTLGVTNLELTAAYASIANGGEYIAPSFYTEVYDHDGNLLLDNSTKERHTVISEQTAWLLTDAMRDVMTGGTGTRAYFGGMDQAGKTGTTTANRDSLFAGYTPYYTCVVWGGYDDNSVQVYSNTAYTKNVWREVMKRVHADLEYKTFTRPSGITSASICMDSGLRPQEKNICKKCEKGNAVYSEYFAVGTVPSKTCEHHIQLEICEETGLIANEFCPKDQVVKKVFLYGGNPNTIDKEYMVTDEFLSEICTHEEEPEETETEEPDSEDEDDKPDKKPDKKPSSEDDEKDSEDKDSEDKNSEDKNSEDKDSEDKDKDKDKEKESEKTNEDVKENLYRLRMLFQSNIAQLFFKW